MKSLVLAICLSIAAAGCGGTDADGGIVSVEEHFDTVTQAPIFSFDSDNYYDKFCTQHVTVGGHRYCLSYKYGFPPGGKYCDSIALPGPYAALYSKDNYTGVCVFWPVYQPTGPTDGQLWRYGWYNYQTVVSQPNKLFVARSMKVYAGAAVAASFVHFFWPDPNLNYLQNGPDTVYTTGNYPSLPWTIGALSVYAN